MTQPPLRKSLIYCAGLNKTGTSTLMLCCRLWELRTVAYEQENFDQFAAGNTEALMRIAAESEAVGDWPWPLLYREADARFPGTKFILTVRSSPERWFDSLCRHAEVTPHGRPVRKRIYGVDDPLGHKDRLIEYYNRHNDDVRKHFAGRPEQFLEVCWERGDGWAELEEFLGMTRPQEEFPHRNQGRPTLAARLRRRMPRLFS